MFNSTRLVRTASYFLRLVKHETQISRPFSLFMCTQQYSHHLVIIVIHLDHRSARGPLSRSHVGYRTHAGCNNFAENDHVIVNCDHANIRKGRVGFHCGRVFGRTASPCLASDALAWDDIPPAPPLKESASSSSPGSTAHINYDTPPVSSTAWRRRRLSTGVWLIF